MNRSKPFINMTNAEKLDLLKLMIHQQEFLQKTADLVMGKVIAYRRSLLIEDYHAAQKLIADIYPNMIADEIWTETSTENHSTIKGS